ncbi:hypothetical protein CHS0354_031366 [Potamilus streckersoni]|uniref:Potassium channel tetramerisation-type BTB domain-containing protein n=1 Tax=Potamilus streckersoni TaxID=2493646 RepID=A0AAE0SKB9_9BIVA|nr:hypothetical protein CHS0354_031366 [Potamilus streckersoni]
MTPVDQGDMDMPASKRVTHEIAPVTSPVGRVQPTPPPIYVTSKVASSTTLHSPAYGATALTEAYSDNESDGELSLHVGPMETLDDKSFTGAPPYENKVVPTFFLDRDPAHFRHILNYLRNRALCELPTLPRELRFLYELKAEAAF